MPIYEYKCDACGKEFEVLTLGMKEEGDTTCPACHSPKTHRLMSRFGQGKYLSLLKGGSSSSSGANSAGSSSCSSCSSSNCSSCGI